MSLLERRRALMSQSREKYVFVEYIESTGTQWIDTGVIANGSTKVDVDFQNTNIYGSFVFGSRTNADLNQYTFNINRDGQWVSAYGDSAKGGYQPLVAADTKRHTVMKNHRTIYIDGVAAAQSGKQDFTTPGNLELFACYNGGTKGYLPSQMKLYSCAIYDGVTEGARTLLRDFKPCYRKVDKVGGLYDTVSGEFFENQGTGNFLIGGEL
jgi:hypothetical protein